MTTDEAESVFVRRPPSGFAVGKPSGCLPRRGTIKGGRVMLEAVDPDRHGAALFAAAHSADDVAAHFEYMPYGPWADEAAFVDWLRGCAANFQVTFYAVVDRSDGPRGMTSFLNVLPQAAVLEIGHIWFSPRLQRTSQATEAIALMLGHAFDDLGYRRVEWRCNALNAPSRRAADRLGFRYEGTLYQHNVVKGKNRDTALYAMLDGDWPALKQAYRTWLNDENFEADGRQRQSLSALTAAALGGGP